jgi:hypothetical protein
MKTLILGHGRNYTKTDTRNSPCDIDKWYNTKYTCVDIDPNSCPDIVFDLRKEWTFCSENEYDLIIDTSGLALGGSYNGNRKGYSHYFMTNKILFTLNENGIFYGPRTCLKKINGELLNYTEDL